MEIRINLDTSAEYQINEDITFDEIDSEGYFYIHSTEKIIVMNDTCYFLWKCILKCAEEKQEISIALLRDLFQKQFIFECSDNSNFASDMKVAIYHFVNECFLKVV